jgi:hypothetical protein
MFHKSWDAIKDTQNSIGKQKSLILNTMGSSTIINIVHFKYEPGHQNKLVSICSDIFLELFTPHLFKKIQDFII